MWATKLLVAPKGLALRIEFFLFFFCRLNWTKMVNNMVDSARALSVTGMKFLKKFINTEISGLNGPAEEYAGIQIYAYFYVFIRI